MKTALLLLLCLQAGEKTERFDRDPGWDGRNNRIVEAREIKQDFGEAAGRIGGWITPAAEPAYYAKVLGSRSLKDRFTASGTLAVEPGGGNTLVGFFNAETVNEWRTPNSIVLRINGRGDGFHVHLEYATSKWRAGGDFYSVLEKGKKQMRLHASGAKAYRWTLSYESGTVTAALDGETLALPFDAGHVEDGATFNRFGILNVMKSADGGGRLWLSELKVDGDGKWESLNNVRPRFDFGWSATRHAGGAAAGELGGLVFRGDERYPDKLAYYGDRLKPLTLEKPLKASGRIALRRAVTDSTVLIGFFHSTESMRPSQAQSSGFPENFLGAAIEGPSRDGFLFYPAYGVDREGQTGNGSRDQGCPHIYPDGVPHAWTLDYQPAGQGTLTVGLGGKTVAIALSREHRAAGARFDRFGIITTHIDGNGQHVYFDDLTYTADQDAR
jgi:hypothetical protein